MASKNNLLSNYEESLNDVTIDDVNRVLELGRLLLSVLTQEEFEELQRLLNPDDPYNASKNGNASVT